MKIGAEIKFKGLDMDCRTTIEIARITEILNPDDNENGYDCVIKCSDGISVLSNSSEFLGV